MKRQIMTIINNLLTPKLMSKRLNDFARAYEFETSTGYWAERYKKVPYSGPGSYGQLARYKAHVVTKFIAETKISSVVELGCGDGNQTSLISYPQYHGLDIAPSAIETCKKRFDGIADKSFSIYNPNSHNPTLYMADLAVSLEVIFHLVEDEIFEKYMSDLFSMSRKYVILFTSDKDYPNELMYEATPPHVRHHYVTKWISNNLPQWKLKSRIDSSEIRKFTFSDFYVFEQQTEQY